MDEIEANEPRPAGGELLGRYPIRTLFDRFAARGAVREHARSLGFSHVSAEELVVVASELCSNVVKYGVRGWLRVERIVDARRGPGLLLCAEDLGAPFRDFERALEDGRDDLGSIPPEALLTRSGIGAGLGAVRRFSHLVWHENLDGGKRIFALRFVR